jgi:hypothetical protein
MLPEPGSTSGTLNSIENSQLATRNVAEEQRNFTTGCVHKDDAEFKRVIAKKRIHRTGKPGASSKLFYSISVENHSSGKLDP